MAIEINNLPDEILEFILSYIPPYQDLIDCKLVCKRWLTIVENVLRRTELNFYKGLCDFHLCWKSYSNNNDTISNDNFKNHFNNVNNYINNNNTMNNNNGSTTMTTPIIAGRFSHSAVVHENSMYIFGGGSSTDTTFNDLWRFDLSKRQWIRPLSMGSYPSPKGSATLVSYNNQLILFGGWRYASLHPPYQPWWLFDELHVYDIKDNRWILQAPSSLDGGPPPVAGHSATIHKNYMIVFGGYKIDNQINSNSNEVWCLNLDTFNWSQPNVGPIKPPARYGQYQTSIDDKHLLIIGGCGGPNNMFNDAWLLDMTNNDKWIWSNIPIKNKKWSASHMWCNPACRVGSKLIVLGPTPNLPNDFQILKQRQSGSNISFDQFLARFRSEDNDRAMNAHAEPDDVMYVHLQRILSEDAVRRMINRRNHLHHIERVANEFRNYFNNNSSDSDNDNDALNDNAANGGNNRNAQPVAGCSHHHQQHKQQRKHQNKLVDEEAANRLQRNLALKSRMEDISLPKRFDEPFEDRFSMAAFIEHGSYRVAAREKQLERHNRLEERRNVLRRRSHELAEAAVSQSLHQELNQLQQRQQQQLLQEHQESTQQQPPQHQEQKDQQQETQKPQQQQDQQPPSPKRSKRNSLALFICDFTNVLSSEPYLEWIEYKNYGVVSGAPERLILSSIVAGNGELIMFGGVHKETLSEATHQVSNKIHFLTVPKQVV